MTKKFNLKNKVLGYFLILLGFLGSSAFNKSHAQSPYCSAITTNACSSNNMYIGIIRVQQGSNVLFSKADDACTIHTTAGSGYKLMTSSPSFTLSGGSVYSFAMSTGPNYVVHIGVWVDLNQDNDFDDGGEWISNGWTDIAQGVGNAQTRNFTLSCNGIKAGNTRMRVRSEYGSNGAFSAGSACTTIGYGETEDYTIKLALPTSISAGFFMPTTAYVNTLVRMTNANQSGYTGHQWDIFNNNTIDYTSTNAAHKFTTVQQHCVQLKSQNCLGRDSILKCVNVINPSTKPVVDFAANTNEVEKYGTINFIDLSTQGPTYWSWYMYDPADSIASRQDVQSSNGSLLVGGDAVLNANPPIFFTRTGTYTVCMQASNSIGPSALVCKKDYVRITPFKDNPMGAGTVQPIFESQGTILDNGGRDVNYSDNRIDYATIIPCGASKITLTFKQFKVAAGDLLKIYDGPDASGKPLHPGTGFTAGMAPTGPVIATSGAMYLYFSTNTTGNDSGFIASWTTEKGPVVPPVADFIIPDTLYNPVWYTYKNTSQNVLGKTDYVWTIEPGYSEVGYAKDLDFAIYQDDVYDVRLDATTCGGTSDITKKVVVVTPHTKAELDFKADNRRPSTGEVVTITPFRPVAGKALITDKYQWTFFPNTVTIVSQDFYTGAVKVKFNAKGKYTVQMKGWNSIDDVNTSNTIIKADYVIVVEYCIPLISVSASADIAINNVKLTDKAKNKVMIDNTTNNNTQGYDDYTLNPEIFGTVTFGSTYNVFTSRFTNINPMTRRIWIDWNIDGDFDDVGELIASESAARTFNFTADFTVPDITTSFEGKTRMRIATSYSLDPNLPCGASSGTANANRLGEFEDYRIFITNDNTAPKLTLNDKDTLYLEVGTTYVEYGATAIDPTEGDISKNITSTSDLDMGFTGVYYINYNVKDAGGNPALPVTRVIYVVKDQTAPVITLNGSDTVRVEVFSTYTEDGAKAKDNKDGNVDNAIVLSGTVNTSKLGTYILTYSVNDQAGNNAKKIRVVIVRDSEKPVINNTDADVNNEIKVQIVSIFVDRTKVTDNYDDPTMVITNGPGTLDGVDTRFKGTYTLIYNATDVSGNKAATKVYKYIVEDYVGPKINLNTLDTVVWPVNKAYVPVQASVEDNYYNASELSLTRTSSVNPFKLGIGYDEYTATDGSGNVTVRRRFVRIIDDVAPIINGSSMNVGLWSNIDVSEGLTITDNYDAPAALRPRLIILFNNLNTYVEGLYTVTFRVSDLSGNWSMPYERMIWVSRTFETKQNGVSEIDIDKTLNVYPNPSTGIINIAYNFATPETMEVQVYNATGALVAEISNIHGQSGTQTIDLSDEASGLYTVRMRTNGRQVTRKVSLRRGR